MDTTSKPESNSKLVSLFEALTLVSMTLLLIGLYLYASGSIGPGWLTLFTLLVQIGILGNIAASYHQINETRRIAGARRFRVTRQLVETLLAKQAPPDVIFGLSKMIKQGDVVVEGETPFIKRLDEVFGKERSSEVQELILRYARLPEGEGVVAEPAPVASVASPALQEKAATAA